MSLQSYIEVDELSLLLSYHALENVYQIRSRHYVGGWSRGSCFPLYHYRSPYFATARHVVNMAGVMCSTVQVSMDGQWHTCTVVPTTNSRVEMMSNVLDLAIIKLNFGDAPPGVRIAPTPRCARGYAGGWLYMDDGHSEFKHSEGTITQHGQYLLTISAHCDHGYSGGPIVGTRSDCISEFVEFLGLRQLEFAL